MAYGTVNAPGSTQADLDRALEEAKCYTDEHTEKDVSKDYMAWKRVTQERPVIEFAQTLPDGSYRFNAGNFTYRIRHITASGFVFTWLEEYTDEGGLLRDFIPG